MPRDASRARERGRDFTRKGPRNGPAAGCALFRASCRDESGPYSSRARRTGGGAWRACVDLRQVHGGIGETGCERGQGPAKKLRLRSPQAARTQGIGVNGVAPGPIWTALTDQRRCAEQKYEKSGDFLRCWRLLRRRVSNEVADWG